MVAMMNVKFAMLVYCLFLLTCTAVSVRQNSYLVLIEKKKRADTKICYQEKSSLIFVAKFKHHECKILCIKMKVIW